MRRIALLIEKVPTRRYPETTAAHLFGYVGEVSDALRAVFGEYRPTR